MINGRIIAHTSPKIARAEPQNHLYSLPEKGRAVELSKKLLFSTLPDETHLRDLSFGLLWERLISKRSVPGGGPGAFLRPNLKIGVPQNRGFQNKCLANSLANLVHFWHRSFKKMPFCFMKMTIFRIFLSRLYERPGTCPRYRSFGILAL